MFGSSTSLQDRCSALKTVQEPELHQDLVTLNMIRDIQIDDGNVALHGHADDPGVPVAPQIEE